MRENRTHGSEGGEGENLSRSLSGADWPNELFGFIYGERLRDTLQRHVQGVRRESEKYRKTAQGRYRCLREKVVGHHEFDAEKQCDMEL